MLVYSLFIIAKKKSNFKEKINTAYLSLKAWHRDIIETLQHEHSCLMSSRFLYASSQYSSLRTTVHKRKYFENGLSFLVRGHWALETYNRVHVLYTSQEVQNHEIYVSGFRTNGDKIVLRRILQNFFSCFWSQTAGGQAFCLSLIYLTRLLHVHLDYLR